MSMGPMVRPPTFVRCLLDAEHELVQGHVGAAGCSLRSSPAVVTAGGAEVPSC